MKTTPPLFEAFLKCPTKCWLRSRSEPTGNEYAEWVRSQNESYRVEGIKRMTANFPTGERVASPSETENPKTAKWRFAVDFSAQGQNAESTIHAVERVPSQRRGKAASFTPIRFVFTNKLTRDDKLLVAFDDLVLSELLGRGSGVGKIIHGDNHDTLKVKTSALAGEVQKQTEKLAALLANSTPPELVLNRHCGECEFQTRCRAKAIEKDDLSLLAGMGEKERKKLHSKGIFTVTQLSYTFRPRRRPKRLRDKKEKYQHSLKALAIREKKIHVVGTPELKIDGTPVYLDVEGLPDCDFYYLIGMRIGNGETAVQHSLWADAVEEEGKIWREFIAFLETVERPVLIHYGSYETTFLKAMAERYGGPPEGSAAAKTFASTVNLLSVMFAQIYFPTHSNGLKGVAGWLGFTWVDSTPLGIRTVMWRMIWQKTGSPSLRKRLLRYNSDDCEALKIVSETLRRVSSPDHRVDLGARADPIAVLAEEPASKNTLWPRFSSSIQSFEAINKAARWDPQRERVYVRTDPLLRDITKGHKGVKRAARINKTVICVNPSRCPGCSGSTGRNTKTRTKTLYDLRFCRFGINRWVVKYRFHVRWCPTCHKCFGVPAEFWPKSKFGRNLVSFIVYETIELCVAQHAVTHTLNRLFGMGVGQAIVNGLKASAGRYYSSTRLAILAKMIKGNVIHADETPIVLKHKRGYVWVITSFREVAYFYTETREGGFVEDALKEFKGVLVSDFFAPYTSLSCPQQKCLIHLIRDLNEAVLDNPYDAELKQLVTEFGELLQSIVKTIDQRGLKCRFLKRHLIAVARFYRRMAEASYESEAALKIKGRFVKNRNVLFTFLSQDGIPWNNNNAEHAIKAFARLRRAILGLSTAKGIEEYLILLSICQTCKYSGLDFLDFLRSGEKDIDAFADSNGRRKPRKAENLETVETG